MEPARSLDRSTISLLACALSSALGTACVPYYVPHAMLPVRAELGVGTTVGRFPEPGALASTKSGGDLVHGRVGLHPLQGFNDLHGRAFDLGVGVLWDGYSQYGDHHFQHRGYYAEGTWFPWPLQKDESGLRLGLYASGELLAAEDASGAPGSGVGATAGLLLDLTTPMKVIYDPCRSELVGGMYGEAGLGVALGASWRHLYGQDFGGLTASLVLRLPFGAAVRVRRP